jgi:hypothetical protein
MSWYAADGTTNVTVVTGSTFTGAQAADGSLNVIAAPGGVFVGRTHPCGARYVTVAPAGSFVGRIAPDGSTYINTTPAANGALNVTGYLPPVTLNALTLSPLSATAGSGYSGTITGKTTGSTITATSSDGTVLTVTGTTVTGTFSTGGTPTITLTETLAGATNTPRASIQGTFTVSSVQPTVRTINSYAWTGASQVVTIPAGNVGEPIFIFCNDQVTALSGWTQNISTGSFGGALVTYTRIADGSETTVTLGDGGLSGYGSHAVVVRVQNATAFENANYGGGNWGPVSPVASNTIATTVANELIIHAAHVQGAPSAFTNLPQSGYTTLYNHYQVNAAADASRDGSLAVIVKNRATAGTEASFNWAWGTAGATSTSFTEAVVAVK